MIEKGIPYERSGFHFWSIYQYSDQDKKDDAELSGGITLDSVPPSQRFQGIALPPLVLT